LFGFHGREVIGVLMQEAVRASQLKGDVVARRGTAGGHVVGIFVLGFAATTAAGAATAASATATSTAAATTFAGAEQLNAVADHL
jgi:hypothetical protein